MTLNEFESFEHLVIQGMNLNPPHICATSLHAGVLKSESMAHPNIWYYSSSNLKLLFLSTKARKVDTCMTVKPVCLSQSSVLVSFHLTAFFAKRCNCFIFFNLLHLNELKATLVFPTSKAFLKWWNEFWLIPMMTLGDHVGQDIIPTEDQRSYQACIWMMYRNWKKESQIIPGI